MLSERMKSLRNEYGISQQGLADRLGISFAAISMYERGLRDPSTETIIKMADVLHCSVDYLLGVTDERKKVDTSNLYHVPLYGTISAGSPNWVNDSIEGYIPLDVKLLDLYNPEEYFFLKIKGDSMNKVIASGAYALIHKQNFVENGDIAVVLVNGDDATLKKFTRKNGTIILEPMSTNPSYQLQVYDSSTRVEILGKYKGKLEL